MDFIARSRAFGFGNVRQWLRHCKYYAATGYPQRRSAARFERRSAGRSVQHILICGVDDNPATAAISSKASHLNRTGWLRTTFTTGDKLPCCAANDTRDTNVHRLVGCLFPYRGSLAKKLRRHCFLRLLVEVAGSGGGRQSRTNTTDPEFAVFVAYRQSVVTKVPPLTIASAWYAAW